MLAYKLFRTKTKQKGVLFPLYVNSDQALELGKWYPAEIGALNPEGKVKSKLGALACRPGWHSNHIPVATHIGGKLEKGRNAPAFRKDNEVWALVEIKEDVDWQVIANQNGTKNGKFSERNAHITDKVPSGGYYYYKTSPNMKGKWIISGEIKILKVLSDNEVQQINIEHNEQDLPRLIPLDLKSKGF